MKSLQIVKVVDMELRNNVYSIKTGKRITQKEPRREVPHEPYNPYAVTTKASTNNSGSGLGQFFWDFLKGFFFGAICAEGANTLFNHGGVVIVPIIQQKKEG